MEKIPTIFKRGDDFGVIDEWTPGCEWVRDGEGVATEKLDGSNVRVTVDTSSGAAWLEKRRNPSKAEKEQGVEPGYAPTDRGDPSDKHLFAAFDNTDVLAWGDGVYTCEAIGPKIQGNPLGLDSLRLIRHVDAPVYLDIPIRYPIRTFDGLREFFADLARVQSPYAMTHRDDDPTDASSGLYPPVEGIVFHHPDGRMAKIKRKDFR